MKKWDIALLVVLLTVTSVGTLLIACLYMYRMSWTQQENAIDRLVDQAAERLQTAPSPLHADDLLGVLRELPSLPATGRKDSLGSAWLLGYAKAGGIECLAYYPDQPAGKQISPLAADSALAKLVRRAAQGENGTTVLVDERGHESIAAFANSVKGQLGIAAVHSVDGVRQPVLVTFLACSVAVLCLVVIGIVIILRVTRVFVRQLFESEARGQLFADLSREGILVQADAKIVDANAGLCRISGRARPEILGANAIELLVAPECRPAVERALQAGYSKPFDTVCVRKGGEPFPAELETRYSTAKGKTTQIIYVRDLSKRKATAELLSFLTQKGWVAEEKDFLSCLAETLARLTRADAIVIGSLQPEQKKIVAQLRWVDGELAPPLAFSYEHSPFETVVDSGRCVAFDDIRTRFPENVFLDEIRAQTMTAVPLWDSRGRALGVLAAIARQPLFHSTLVADLLQIAAPRIAHDIEERHRAAELDSSKTLLADATERHRLERQLRESEGIFRRLVAHVTDAIVLIDFDGGRILDTNPAAERFTGYSHEQLVQMPVAALYPPDVAETAKRFLSNRVNQPQGTVITELLRADGSALPVEISMSLFIQDKKRFVAGVFRDVSDRIRVEDALHASEERLRGVFDAIPAGAFLVDQRGVIAIANQTMAEMFGCPLNQIVGSSYERLVHPADRSEEQTELESVLAGRQATLASQRRFVRANGEVFSGLRICKRRASSDDSHGQWIGVVADLAGYPLT